MTILLARHAEFRHFPSYSGVNLPQKLVGPIPADALSHRNTCIRAFLDSMGALFGFDKRLYGDAELAHRYEYDRVGALRRACVQMLDEEPVRLSVEPAGEPGN